MSSSTNKKNRDSQSVHNSENVDNSNLIQDPLDGLQKPKTFQKLAIALLAVVILGVGYYMLAPTQTTYENCVEEVSLEELEELQPANGEKSEEEKLASEDTTATEGKKAEDKKTAEVQKPAEDKKPAEDNKSASSGESDWKKYEEMDSRLRYGGFYIMGLDYTLKAQAGDNARKISKRVFGSEEGSCYICVFNGITDNQVLEVGKEIKIPKLESKLAVKNRSKKE